MGAHLETHSGRMDVAGLYLVALADVAWRGYFLAIPCGGLTVRMCIRPYLVRSEAWLGTYG